MREVIGSDLQYQDVVEGTLILVADRAVEVTGQQKIL